MSTWYPYIRHSTEEANQPNSRQGQQRDIGQYGLHKQTLVGVEPGPEYLDADISGSIPFFERPAGSILQSRLKPGDHIVAAKFDRMFRNVKDFIEVCEWCLEHRVLIHVVDMEIDTSTAAGRAVAQIRAVFAEMELGIMAERIRKALDVLKYTKGICVVYGEPIGWKRVRKGTQLNRKGHPYGTLAPDNLERAECEEIVMRHDKMGWSYQKIADHFNKYGRIHARLKREHKPTGELPDKWNHDAVYKRYKKAKAGFPCGNYDKVDGQNSDQLMGPAA